MGEVCQWSLVYHLIKCYEYTVAMRFLSKNLCLDRKYIYMSINKRLHTNALHIFFTHYQAYCFKVAY
jgi:hypothetical protein